MADANRQIARRDARKEGEPDAEPSAELPEKERAMKDAQRDLTSLSGPVPRARDPDAEDPGVS